MIEPRWISKAEALTIHDRQLRVHGGPAGTRDDGMLESALGRPENLFAYGAPDLADLAAAYAFGIAKNHPFVDGNKRAAFTVCATFLRLNGMRIPIDDAANIATWVALAAGKMTEDDLAAWLRERVRPLG